MRYFNFFCCQTNGMNDAELISQISKGKYERIYVSDQPIPLAGGFYGSVTGLNYIGSSGQKLYFNTFR